MAYFLKEGKEIDSVLMIVEWGRAQEKAKEIAKAKEIEYDEIKTRYLIDIPIKTIGF